MCNGAMVRVCDRFGVYHEFGEVDVREADEPQENTNQFSVIPPKT
jgi:hypothetical protein